MTRGHSLVNRSPDSSCDTTTTTTFREGNERFSYHLFRQFTDSLADSPFMMISHEILFWIRFLLLPPFIPYPDPATTVFLILLNKLPRPKNWSWSLVLHTLVSEGIFSFPWFNVIILSFQHHIIRISDVIIIVILISDVTSVRLIF